MNRYAWFASWLVLAATVSVTGAGESKSVERPNIVLILADDMGFSDLGCYGAEIATPNLDRLAAEGMRFSQFYNCARCCPTRASLLTGLYPHQAGVGHMLQETNHPGYRSHLNDQCVTMAEVLRASGYNTILTGKWHVGPKMPNRPTDRGFDHYLGLVYGGSNYFYLYHPMMPGVLLKDEQSIPASGERFYMTDAFTDGAIEFLDGQKSSGKPFFLHVAYTAPHWPLHAWPEDIAKYRGKYKIGWDEVRKRRHARQIEMGLLDGKWPLTRRDSAAPAWSDAPNQDDLDLRMSVYAAQIDRMDQNIGRIMAKIRQLGVEQNTLVMFLSDNGGCAEAIDFGKPGAPPGHRDSFTSYGLPWANASNTPFRLFKHWVHEGGISTPMIVNWPAVIRDKGSITHQVGHIIDLMATFVDVADATYPAEFKGKKIVPMQGKSLLPIFRGEQRAGHDALFWEHEGNKAVRQGKWKLVLKHPAEWNLYDMQADRTEMHNLASEYPDKVREMSSLWDRWAADVGVVPWDELPFHSQAKKAAKTQPAK